MTFNYSLFEAEMESAWKAIKPESALLLACARLEMEEQDRAVVAAAIRRPLDWNLFLSLAGLQGLTAMVFRHLGGLSGVMPDRIKENLGRATHDQARRNLSLTAELVSLLRAFGERGIRVISLKGPILAEQVYGSVALRRMRDLDFLVEQSDIERVFALLRDRGYRVPSLLDKDLEEIRRRKTHHFEEIVSETRGYILEIHHDLVPPVGRTRSDFGRVLAHTQPALFMNIPIAKMRPEALLVYLCEHGNHHAWSRLEWLSCIAELLRSGSVRDWDGVAAFAEELGGLRRLDTTLLIARDLLGAPVPKEMLCARRSTQAAARSVIQRFVTNPHRKIAEMETFLFELATDSGLSWTLHRCWLAMIPTVSDVQAIPLPRALWFLHYIIRPVWLLLRYVPFLRKIVGLRNPAH